MQSNKFSQRQLTGFSHCDGQGLYIVKKEPHAGKWVFRFNYLGRARQMGSVAGTAKIFCINNLRSTL